MDYLQEYKTSNILRKFLKEAPSISTVIRCGVVQGIPSKDLIIGDVVVLRAGDRIPCDLRIFYAKDLFVNNSSITGEGEGQERFPYPTTTTTDITDNDFKPLFIEAKNIAFGGTLVIEGEGYGIVIRRGRDSVMGEIALMTIVEKPPKSQMKIEIENFVKIIVGIALVTVAIFFVQSLIRGYDIEIIFSFSIGIFVSYVPQGLPLTMSTLLTIAAKRMAKRNVLVKNLQAVETLGSITLLATDKTGTLTQNKMNVISCWMNGMFYEVPSQLFDKSDDDHNNDSITIDNIVIKEQQQQTHPQLSLFKEHDEIFKHPNLLTAETPNLFSLLQVCSLCSRAKINTKIPSSEEGNEIVGDATEIGLLKFAMKMLPFLEFPITKLTEWQDRWEKVYEIPFNSSTKWHLTVHYIPKEDRKMAKMHSSSSYRVFIKGAPERISRFCKKTPYSPSSQWGKDLRDWSPEMDEKLREAYEHFASTGKRVLALATMDLPSSRYWEGFLFTKQSVGPELQNDSLDNFVFLGILAIMDPPKHGVRKTIKCCRAAGIQLVMITGDHALTAEAIGRQVGLISGDSSTSNDLMIIINGEELSHFTKKNWKEVLRKEEVIFARTSPQQKLEIVTKFQQKGHIVGVSGDGINDGPAIKKADLGISMNRMASDIAKDAAAMILLDDNFTSIIHGISEGRLIFENLQKCIRYVTSHTIPEVVAFVLFISLGIPTPLNVFYALLIDLGSELLPGLSFAFEPPEGNLMLIGPRKIILIDDDDDEVDDGFADKFENISLDNERCNSNGNSIGNGIGIGNSNSNVIGGDIESQSHKKRRKKKEFFSKNYKGKVLVDSSMIIWSYLQVGIIQSLGCIGAYLITFSWYDIPFSSLISSNQTYFKADSPPFPVGDGTTTTIFLSAEEQVRIVKEAVASYYWSIVIFQQFNLWICKHHFTYPYGKDMLRNRITYIGAVGALVIATMVVWIPGLNDALGGSPPPWAAFISPITAGLFLFLYEFIRRYLHIHHVIGNDPDINNTSLKDFIRTTTNTAVKE